ncbi:hypothetical protein QE374_000432 [Microbacterium sp. SORGH_AS428]|uniref:hypothetical protein n=1 Tax=Microbacterium sp. SORGH_AS_0428 TaxID=3041788 RepID=UPI00285E4E97|nr:hypothetical protein [Microbacterium sp. SORGH_AS_0428]MDR6198523.1 hypothetical protein [Microbacterium sp. SORGH_AS_0428]
MRRSRLPRLLRGTTSAAVATFVALLSHVSAGGAVPGWLGILIPFVLSLAVCTVLTGRRLSVWRLSVAVALSQALFHTLFVLGSFAVPGMGQDHHAMHGMGDTQPVPSTGMTDALHGDPAMWLGHAVAAVVTILALHRGERCVRALIELTRTLVGRLRIRLALVVADVDVDAPRFPSVACARHRQPGQRLFLRDIARRGPPRLHTV